MKNVFSFEPHLTNFLHSTTLEFARDKAFSDAVRNLLERCWKEWPATEYGELPPNPVKQLDSEISHKKDAKKEQEIGPDLKALWNTPYKLWEHAIHAHLLAHLATEFVAVQQNEQAFFDYLEKIFEFSLHFADIAGGFHLELPTRMIRETLNTLTIEHCFKVFTWIEGKAQRLVPKNKDPDRSNSMRNLALLRGLNDLLKRVSKSTKSGLSARVQFFISALFPLSERSAVNLRGFYGDPWSGPPSYADGKAALLAADSEAGSKKDDDDKMTLDVAPQTAAEKRQFLFDAFWWLQYPFSRPFVFAEPGSLKAFIKAVDIVLPVLQEANKKDRQMAGGNKDNATNAKSTANAGAKRKRVQGEDEEMVPVEKKPRLDGLSQTARDKLDSLYKRVADLESDAAQRQTVKVDDPSSKSTSSQMTFIKYLTSPDLLDLELSDPNFRRQFLFQLLITLHHLKTYTKDQKAAWCAGANKSLQIGGGTFTLNEGEEEGWVLEKERKCIIEMRFTGIATSTSSATKGEGVGIDGRAFQDMVALILEREQNWVDWKAKGCPAFEKLPTSSKVIRDSQFNRAELLRRLENWEHRLGSAPLTTIWEDGYYSLNSLINQAELPDVDEYLRPIEQVDAQIKGIVDKYKKSVAAAEAARAKAEYAMTTDDPPTAPMEQTADPEKASTSTHRSLPSKLGDTDTPADNKLAFLPSDMVTTSSNQLVAEQLPRIPAVESKELEKQTYSWLALRSARNQYLNAFSDRKIGVADVHSLIKEVKRIKEDEKRREDIFAGKIVCDPGAPPPTGAAALSTPAPDTMKALMLPLQHEERDLKMEDGELNGEVEIVIVESQSGATAVDSQNAAPRMEVD